MLEEFHKPAVEVGFLFTCQEKFCDVNSLLW